MQEQSFYLRDGRSFVPTALTRGPWSNQHQHGGPPAALLGSAIEAFGEDSADFFLVRLTIELLRPAPIEQLHTDVQYVTRGKTAQRLAGVLSSDGKELLRASGLRLRRRALVLPEGVTTPAPEATPPEALEPFCFPFFQHEIGYHRAIDLRFARGTWPDRDVIAWARPKVSLVAGEPLTALERVLIIVDAESGICPPLNPSAFTFVNPDLTLYLERPLEGGWLGLEIRSAAQPIGTGIAESSLFDNHGRFGRSVQSLTVSERER